MKINVATRAVPPAGAMAKQIGAGRTAFALAFLAAPVAAARLLGTDTATAQRVVWLTRMMAVRDGAIGVGGLAAGGGAAPWLLAGAVSDAVDAAVLGTALRQGRLKGLVPTAVVPLAGVTALVGVWTALRVRRAQGTSSVN
jgi:hypothetical protein